MVISHSLKRRRGLIPEKKDCIIAIVGTGQGKFIVMFVALILVLGALGGWLLWWLLSSGESANSQSDQPTSNKVIAKQELAAFTLLKSDDMEAVKGSEESANGNTGPKVEDFEGRYLLEKVKRNGEIKAEKVAPSEATELISRAIAVSIPATSVNSFNGDLKPGDIVDVLAPPGAGGTRSDEASDRLPGWRKFEGLVVLSITPAKGDKANESVAAGAIVLALPSDRRDEFAAALAGTTLLVTRKIVVVN